METSQKRRRYQKDLAPADDIVTLIHLVRQNPTLYNYKLQPNQRRRIDILNGWAQIAAQIGNKYSVEECRRKWKNLRDTYHQYRLRKCKIGDGLSKWRYAKDMEFLSNVYQPKLKSHRIQATTTTTTANFSNTAAVLQNNSIHAVSSERLAEDDEHVVSHDIVHSSIISVNEADTFILTAYEDVTHDNDVTHEDPNMVSHHENSMEGCVELVKHEHTTSLDDEGPNGGEVDYEEVCLYEEGGNAPSVDCETIIGASAGGNSVHSDDAKYHYIDTSDFCMSHMNATPRSHYSSSSNSVIGAAGTTKLKSMSLRTVQNAVTIPSTPSTSLDSTASAASIGTSSMHLHHALPELTSAPIITNSAISTNPSPTTSKADHRFSCSSILAHGSTIIGIPSSSIGNGAGQATSTTTSMYHCAHQREECDLFFDFLKKKIQRFPPEEITSIQVEFLNCVLRREADHAQKNFTQQVINNTSINNTHVI